MVEKKETPKKGEFIDLENTDFKKKKSFFKIFITYLLLFLFLSLLFFVAFKNDFWGILEKKQESKISIEKNYFGEENKLKIENNKKEIDIIYNLIDTQKSTIIEQEEINRKIESKLNNIQQTVDSFKEFDPQDNFLLDFKRNKVLVSFLIFKKNYEYRREFGNELDILSSLFVRDPSITNNITFFKEMDIRNLKKSNFLLNKININLAKYEDNLTNLFQRIENNDRSNKDNMFKSKEDFANYLKEVFNATFKITKYKDNQVQESEKQIEPLKGTLLSLKETLLLNDLTQFIAILETSEIYNQELSSLLNDARQLNKAEDNFSKLEKKILDSIGQNFD